MAGTAVSAAMSNRRASLLATATLLAATLFSGCGLIASIPGMGAPHAPGAVDPGPPGIGVGVPAGPPDGVIGLPDKPTIVAAHPGQAGLHEVSPVELRSTIDPAGHAIVRVRWWGGIEPCEILDSIDVKRDGMTFTITAWLGSAAGGQVACIDIARDTATLVDLGVLAPGQYSIHASTGDARPLTLTIPEPAAGPS